MATISSLGVGSGLDLSTLLTNLMTAEQQPLLALQKKEASVQARISALGTLKGSLSALQTAAQSLIPATGQSATAKFSTFSAAVTDNTIASATASTGAVKGSYPLEVTALAQAQRLTSPASTDTAGTAALTAALATGGTLKIELGALIGTTGSFSFAADSARELNVTIAAGSTLDQVRDAINAAATDSRVSATIINGDGGKQLVLTSGKSGTANVMKLSGIAGLDYNPAGAGTGTLSQASGNGGQAASDAVFKLNGISVTRSTNTVTDVLDGVTLNLLKTNVGTPTTLTINQDSTSSLTASLNTFIKSYNDAASAMKNLGYYDATTKKAGSLQGDATLRGAQSQIRNLSLTKAGGTSVYQTLSDIGVSLQTDGTLKLDTTKLNNAVTADYAGVATLVSTIGTTFKTGMDSLVGTTGNITAATDSANRMIKELDNRQLALESRLTQIEARYRKQFSALDTLISSMNSTSSYLTEQLANLPGSSSSSSN
jgi:flagellar hook-associated protein 2